MLVVLDPQRFEEKTERLFERLKQRKIEHCKMCGGTGRVLVDIQFEEDNDLALTKSEHCECKRRVLNDLDLFESGLPREFWRADELEPDSNEEHFELAHKIAAKIDKIVSRKLGLSLLMTGENGTGKTTSAAIVMIGAVRKKIETAFVLWPDFVNLSRQGRFDARISRRVTARLQRPLLVIDELGKESKLNDADTFAQQQLDSIIRSRRGARLPTILITNDTPDQFYARYGVSVESGITAPYQILLYEPGDHRARLRESWAILEGGS